ncbi:MAG TPA: CoA transferase [Stellaceae bacterium]|jgi:crotonobetainyl-CoA:carnitine CoA-transferase CaiB-like acyl-CoA transferase|nr:CoA transferase [Stellaceae bacterium]
MGFARDEGALLGGFRVAQIGSGLAAAVAGRLFADIGAEVICLGADRSAPLLEYLNHAKHDGNDVALATAELIIAEGSPAELRRQGHDPEALRRINATAAIITIAPFGQTGPRADEPASDLTLMYGSGIARLLTGQVDNLAEAPIRPVGEQSGFIAGLAAACAGMHAPPGSMIDISAEETLATLAMTELANAGLGGKARSRKRVSDGNGATVCILPASDGYAAISPREDRQWATWLKVMGSPVWGNDPRFKTKPDRVANWDALHALMSEWSRGHTKQWIADAAQEAHVPSFPLREPAEQLRSPQLAHRGYWRDMTIGGRGVKAPGPPFGLSLSSGQPKGPAPGGLPLAGIRVLDFSWVIAGPTATRYLAAMGAEVVKIEAPGRGDPGRASELHTVLGQAKKGIVLDLKNPEAVALARDLAARADVVFENFATGVMDRLGLGAAELQALNPNLLYVSASGMGRTGPEAHSVAYGTLLQCYTGFAGLNRHPGIAPRVGFAWLDPMCGLMLAFIVAAALKRRAQDGAVARIDFSMIEAILWTMAAPLLATQLDASPKPQGNRDPRYAPHGAYRCAGDDEWISLAITTEDEWHRLCAAIPALEPLSAWALRQRQGRIAGIDGILTGWASRRSAREAETVLRDAAVPAAALRDSVDLVGDAHLRERGFWDAHGKGVLPGLPWHASFARATGPAPGLGADTDAVLRDVLGLAPERIATLRASGALG